MSGSCHSFPKQQESSWLVLVLLTSLPEALSSSVSALNPPQIHSRILRLPLPPSFPHLTSHTHHSHIHPPPTLLHHSIFDISPSSSTYIPSTSSLPAFDFSSIFDFIDKRSFSCSYFQHSRSVLSFSGEEHRDTQHLKRTISIPTQQSRSNHPQNTHARSLNQLPIEGIKTFFSSTITGRCTRFTTPCRLRKFSPWFAHLSQPPSWRSHHLLKPST